MEIIDHEMVFSFPDVHDRAVLRIHFQRATTPGEPVPLNPVLVDGGVLLGARCRFVMHLRPACVYTLDSWASAGARYPFAVVVSVGGINAITGEAFTALARSPQNYFATPPQGGVDGYFVGGHVLPFHSGEGSPLNRKRLDLKVFPMKSAAFAYLEHLRRLIPGPGPSMRGFTLPHGGERQCEPIYEDLSGIGSWDWSKEKMASLWLSARPSDPSAAEVR